MRGAALELVTVGFYRFWLATDMRRHLWSNTAVGGDAAEYTGTAKELLIGFLFALAILAPIYLVYFLIGLEAERLQAFASVPLGLFFYPVRPVRHLSRAPLPADAHGLARRALLDDRLGLELCMARRPCGACSSSSRSASRCPGARPRSNATRCATRHYGNLQGRFEGTGGDLFKKVWWLWLLMWPSVFLLIPLPFIYAAFKAIEWRWWVSGLRIGEVRFESDLRMRRVHRPLLEGDRLERAAHHRPVRLDRGRHVGDRILRALRTSLPAGAEVLLRVSQQLPVLLMGGLGYIVTALAVGVVIRIYLMRDLWQRVAESATVHNLAAADDVTAQGELVSALGEGFANSLDVAGSELRR